jgi:hypothetical protein
MTAVVDLEECRSEVSSDKYPSRARVGKSSSGGGGMDDVLKRLGVVESSVSEMREEVRGIAAIIPHLATKADLSEIREQVSSIAATIPHLATKADLRSEIGSVRGEIRAVETAIIKWIIAIVISSAGLAFTIAKFVH